MHSRVKIGVISKDISLFEAFPFSVDCLERYLGDVGNLIVRNTGITDKLPDYKLLLLVKRTHATTSFSLSPPA